MLHWNISTTEGYPFIYIDIKRMVIKWNRIMEIVPFLVWLFYDSEAPLKIKDTNMLNKTWSLSGSRSVVYCGWWKGWVAANFLFPIKGRQANIDRLCRKKKEKEMLSCMDGAPNRQEKWLFCRICSLIFSLTVLVPVTFTKANKKKE